MLQDRGVLIGRYQPKQETIMGWAAKSLEFHCHIYGYETCRSMSVFEGVVLGGFTLAVWSFLLFWVVAIAYMNR